MVIYTREEKVLIIPEGEGCGCQGGGQPTQRCEREKREAYESGYTAGLHADCGEAIDEAYNSGYTAGLEACSGSTDCSSAITEAYQSGYTEGYNQGQADCPECSGGTCNLQQKVFVVTDPAMENVFPDAGYDGLSQVMLLTTTLWDSAHTSGYNEGYQSGYTAGLNDCSGSSCTLEEGRLDISDFWNGGPTVVYPSTADGFSQFTVEDTNGSYAYKHYMDGYNDGLAQCSGETPCDCSSAVTEAYQSGYTEGYNEGYDDALYEKCDLETTLIVVPSGSTGIMNDITPTEAAGFGSVSVNATEYGEWKYQSGYTAGLEDCSGGTCPTETGLISLDSGWSGYESYQPIGSGYFDEVIITDTGYGQAKFDQGYELGLATCSASSGSCLIEDEQTASLGYDWTGFTIVYPSQGYDGLGRVLVADLGYGQAKYDEGYADGHTSGYTEGYNEAITANCGTAVEEAYESGVSVGYYGNNLMAHFSDSAWVETDMDIMDGDTIIVDFKIGSTWADNQYNHIYLLSNGTSGNTLADDDPYIQVDVYSGGLLIITNDGNGNSQQWGPFHSQNPFYFYANDNYHLVIQTKQVGTACTINVIAMNESRGEIASATTTGAIHFSPVTGDVFTINGNPTQRTDSAAFTPFDDWYLKSLKVFRPSGSGREVPLAANFTYRDGGLYNSVSQTLCEAKSPNPVTGEPEDFNLGYEIDKLYV